VADERIYRRDEAPVLGFVPGEPAFGPDGVIRPRSRYSAYGFIAVGGVLLAGLLIALLV
jgi:hypothetical protein